MPGADQTPFLLYHYEWLADGPRDEQAGVTLSGDAGCIKSGVAGGRYAFIAAISDLSGELRVEDALEEVFRLTNSIHDAWYRREEPGFAIVMSEPVLAKGGARSTSVGDVVIHGNRVFAVAGAGFRKLDIDVAEFPPHQAVVVSSNAGTDVTVGASASRRAMGRP